MKITTENYEEFVLDYLEGELDPETRKMLEAFFREHPRLAPDEEGISSLRLQPEELSMKGKNSLHKSVFDTPEGLEEAAIALSEGDLSNEEVAAFQTWLENHAEAEETVSQFARLKLQPDASIVFPNKAKLKRKTRVLPIWWSVAAAAVLTLGMFLFYPEKDGTVQQSPNPKVAEAPVTDSEREAVPGKEKEGVKDESKLATPPQKKIVREKPLRVAEILPAKAKAIPQKEAQPELERIAMNIPEPMKAKVIRFDVQPEKVVMVLDYEAPGNALADEIPVVDLLDRKLENSLHSEDRELLSSDNIALGGLQLIARASGDRLVGKRGNDGEIKSISFHSRLISFSLPVNKNR
ncbi:hypothetical protein PbJCM13498_15640 [Prolixibacter bellariivorans]|uniref:Uncharacterized protein n=1 Tax=Prolixibacter bellariivorans TaxID=314319 RepID=A0A5M4AYH7_9BACT|nr:hypothetical protein [Prolixibacter bellariivorans]GET32701.1 hypothetical protein PbJCM13498_15640 [Prolixibacter bellariivorans]